MPAQDFEIRLEGFEFPRALPNNRANFRFVVDVRYKTKGDRFATETVVMPGLDTFWECGKNKKAKPNFVRDGSAPRFDMAKIDPWDRLVVRLHADAVYARAAENLRQLLNDDVLVREDEPCLYVYRLVMGDHSQVGLVCCCHIGDYENDVIKKHERTRPDKEDDRTRHMLAIGAHPGPVLLTYRDVPTLAPLFRRDMNSRPLFHFDAPDGVTHTVWPVENPQAYVDNPNSNSGLFRIFPRVTKFS